MRPALCFLHISADRDRTAHVSGRLFSIFPLSVIPPEREGLPTKNPRRADRRDRSMKNNLIQSPPLLQLGLALYIIR